MAQIREELQLVDRFSAQFTRFITLAQQSAQSSRMVQASLNNIETATAATAENIDRLTSEIQNLTSGMEQTQKKGTSLLDTIKKVGAAIGGLQTAKWLVNTSDAMSNINARINMMNDGLQTTEELNEMIYQSAMRSRGSYQDMANFVSQLGNLAGDAFDSNKELIAFAEQVNKQITLSGASAEGASGALLQLTQGLSSGTLRGEELNSVLEQTPTIAQSIAKYMGVTTGEMRELASDGKVTAEVVKNAMFAAAENTNEKFESMPMTWSQVWTRMQNVATKALQPLTDKISELAQTGQLEDAIDTIGKALNGAALAASYLIDGISWLTDVIKDFAPQITLVVGALAAYKLGTSLATIAISVATAAQWAWNAALNANPIGLVIILIVALIAIFITLWDKCEGFRNFWVDMWQKAQESLLWFVNNVVIPVANFFIAAQNRTGEAIINFVKMCINAYYDAAINISKSIGSIIEKMQGLIDIYNSVAQVFGGKTINAEIYTTTYPAMLEEARKNSIGIVDSFAKKYLPQKDMIEKIDEEKFMANVYAAGDQMRNFTFSGTFNRLISDLFGGDGEGKDNPYGGSGLPYTPYEEIASDTGEISKNTKDIKKSVAMSEEDIKSLVDVAERRYVNNINLTAQTPVINVNGANTGNTAADRQSLANAIRDILIEQAASSSFKSTAMVF